MNRARGGGILVGLGILFIVVSMFFGALSPGSELAVSLFLLKVGIVFTVLGAATISMRTISIENAVVVSLVTLGVVFVTSTAIMYYDFTSLPLTRLVAFQGSGTLVMAPIPAGFLAGVLEKRGKPTTAYRTFLGTMVAAWILATLLLLIDGPIAPLGLGPPMAYTIAATFIGILPRNLLRKVAEVRLG